MMILLGRMSDEIGMRQKEGGPLKGPPAWRS